MRRQKAALAAKGPVLCFDFERRGDNRFLELSREGGGSCAIVTVSKVSSLRMSQIVV
jgi:hypothetical protein